MPFFLLIIGIVLLTVAIRGTQADLFTLLKSDFSGQNNFFLWVLAFIILIGLGYWKTIRPATDAFMILLIIVIFLAAYKDDKDLFSSFVSQLKQGTS